MMSSRLQATFLWAVLLLVSGTHTVGLNEGTCWNFDCSTSSSYSKSSGYENNIKIVEKRLPRKASSSSSLFTSGAIGQIHTLAQCRIDIHPAECQTCVSEALRTARSVCAYKHQSVVYCDLCTVAMSSVKMKMFPMEGSNSITASKFNFSQVSIQRVLLDKTITTLTTAVAKKAAEQAERFASGQQVVGVSNTLYALAYCVPNIASIDCDICLRNLIERQIVSALIGATESSIWCTYRFELYPFFNGFPTLDLPAITDGTESAAEKKKKKQKYVLIIVCVIVSPLLLLAVAIAIIWWTKRSRQNQLPRLERGEKQKETECTDRNAEGGSGSVDKVVLHSALAAFEEIMELAHGRTIALFLDYDGTLSPIVKNADQAFMSEEMREVLTCAAALFCTSIVSGRAREKVVRFVKLSNINYAGNHGLDIKTAAEDSTTASDTIEEEIAFQPAKEYLLAINKVFKYLVDATAAIKGVNIEDNKYSVTVHYRNVDEEDWPEVKKIVDEVIQDDSFKLQMGHMIWEIIPAIPWNKGNAVMYLLEKLRLDNPENVFPIYIGDDVTDENAFKVLRERENGVGILVSEVRRDTEAFYSLRDPSEVMEFLQRLVHWEMHKAAEK